ncbi:MAG TPA: GntR family transcriptional regulator [Hypericibacter adhaerens]|uniref:GntR family transcriptional regulator n=1 Tax=Hypericibacter adhaerens TaxID=2602016 RepID=UPI002B591F5F|nr:GntR family transcriptional regulator [Hypericibacter adhaerens]HWA45704.1 GntR family transcriptional regulator [Hypericibacter adhaerens]
MSKGSQARYLVIAESLKPQIAAMAPDTLLPTENELAAQFGVSRVTLRQALKLLEEAGSISRTRGRGTVVNPPKIVRNNIPMRTLEDDFREQGIAFETQILGFEASTQPSKEVREHLRLAPKERVAALRLLRIVNRRVICVEERYCRASLAGRLDLDEIRSEGIVEILSRLSEQPIETVEFETEILPSSGEIASALGLTRGTPVLQNSFVYFLSNGEPVETGLIAYRVDRCKFRAVGRFPLAGKSAAPAKDAGKRSMPHGKSAGKSRGGNGKS